MKKIIIIILLTFIVSITFAQQYTPMTAAGYQMKRLKVDSTLHIPSFCGVPTTRNSTAKEGAVAMDTCNNLLYIWTNLSGWSSISGGTIVDTAAINAAIALRVKYTDTAGMLQPYLRKIDTTNKWVQSVTKLNDSTIRVVKNAITTDLLIRGNGVKYSDTAAMLSKYLRKTDTASLSSRINLKLNISDTATMLSKYLRKTDTASLSTRINLKLNISDTSAMLSKYLRKTDTASLSARINTKLAIADTVNKWVQDVTKLNDSTIRVRKNNTNTDIILPKGTGGGGGSFTSPNLQQVLDSGNVADKKILLVNPYDTSFANIEINPTNFNLSNESPFINLHIGNAVVYPLETFMKLSLGDDASYPKPYIYANDIRGSGQSFFKINSDTLSLRNTTNYGLTNLIMSGTSGNYHMPTTNLAQINDTLATLQDVRLGGGGGGSGTVTSVASGYGLSGGPITTTGTLSVDTSVLNDLYAQNGRFGNDTATILMAKIHNNSGATLTNGKVVFLASSGTNADVPSVRLANSKHDSTSANTFGFVTGSIANNDTGWIILSGKIEKLNTAAYANGDIIYLDTISGNWTKNKPVAPVHLVYLGVVIKANAGNGSIFVKCQNGYELDEIHDVLITSKLNNQVLAYSDTQKVWKNRNIYSIVDTTSLSSRINTKLAITDTSVFQRKSISAYSIMANNTPSAANTTAQVFNDSSVKTYPAANITWTGGTAPTTLTTSTYTFTQVGKMVFLYIYLVYTNAASTPTSLTLQIPSDVPQPSNLGTTAAAGNYTFCSGLTFGRATITTQATTFGNTSFMRRNAGNTAYEMVTFSTNGVFRVVSHSFNYKTD